MDYSLLSEDDYLLNIIPICINYEPPDDGVF